jgi:CHAT domain
VIKTIRQMHGVEVRLADNPTHTQLRKLMNGPEDPEDAGRDVQDRVRFKPDIVHFIAHGEPDRLALIRPAEDIQKDKDDDKPLREAAWCDAQEILDLFANHTPHLVFLQACDTAREVEEKKFSSLARELVYKKIPSVIAMQYSIEVEDAGLFACTFYEEIRQGSHIDEAVRVGREVFGQKQDDRKVFADRRFATPVVYFRQKGAQPLFDRLKQRQSANRPLPNESAKEVPSAGTAVQHRTCPRCDSKAGNVCCTRCLLGFVCDCGNEYVDPLGTYCGNCPRKIEQPPWPTPATAPPTKFDPTGRRSNVPFPQDRESGETISTTAFETS